MLFTGSARLDAANGALMENIPAVRGQTRVAVLRGRWSISEDLQQRLALKRL
jgi:hypothetical protein